MSGLSVIIDIIKESSKILQRMNGYAIYRIPETLRVLLFMTLSILVFQFLFADCHHDCADGHPERWRDP